MAPLPKQESGTGQAGPPLNMLYSWCIEDASHGKQ